LEPYWDDKLQTWVIDDPRRGLFHEPFVNGFTEFLDRLLRDVPDAASGCRIELSDRPFPGYVNRLVQQDEEAGGYWYVSDDPCIRSWFGPAVMSRFRALPSELYVRAQPLQDAPMPRVVSPASGACNTVRGSHVPNARHT